MIYPLVLELADDGVPVAVACRVLGCSKQVFYRWRADPVTERDWADARLTNGAIDAHRGDPTFGYRFIADGLRAAGRRVSERRVWRLCSQQRLWSLHAKKRGLNRKAGPPVHDDRVRRAFTAPDLDKLWLTDITEHPTGAGTLSLCAVKDACSRRIVGYSLGDRMRSPLAVAALRMAVHRRNPTGTVVHSDRGAGRRVRGPCGDGIVLRAPAEERPEPETLGDPGRARAGDHHLDRGDLPPDTPATWSGEVDPDRVRDDHQPTGRTRGLNERVNATCSSPQIHRPASPVMTATSLAKSSLVRSLGRCASSARARICPVARQQAPRQRHRDQRFQQPGRGGPPPPTHTAQSSQPDPAMRSAHQPR